MEEATMERKGERVRDAVIIYNPTSGRQRARRMHELERAAEILKGSGVEAELAPTMHPGAATELARDAVKTGRQMVIACGGDGTINEVINGLAGSDVPLAVLPAGTANILAKEIGIPWNIPEAARLISGGRLARIALGEIVWPNGNHAAAEQSNGAAQRYFLCVGGAGPDGAIVQAIDTESKSRVGILEYWKQGLQQYFSYGFPQFRIATNEKEMTGSLLVVGRTKYYGGPFRITTGASLFEDAFEIVAYSGRNRLTVLLCLPAIWLGLLHRVPGIHVWKTQRIRCEAVNGDRIYAQVDGEAASALPLEFRIVPNALTLVLPATSAQG
jgi:diacylglycerol kinase (ATP)